MVVYQHLLKQRKTTLEKIIKDTKRLLAQAPEGILRIIPHKKGVQYYRRKDTKDYNGSYIRKEDLQLAKNLGQKKYHQMILSTAEKELSLLDNLLDSIDEENINDLYVFCKPFLAKIAKHFWRMLHLQIGESCKAAGWPVKTSQKHCRHYLTVTV